MAPRRAPDDGVAGGPGPLGAPVHPGVEGRGLALLQVGGALNAFGNGLALPYLLIYLHLVRGFSLTTSGLVLAVSSIALIAITPAVGVLVDTIGARRTLTASMSLTGLAMAGFVVVTEPWQAFGCAGLAGLGSGAFRPAHLRLLVGVSRPEAVGRTFAMQRVMNNVGIGAGGLLGGMVAHTGRPATYSALLLADVATFVGYAVLLHWIDPAAGPASTEPSTGYRGVLANRPFRWLLLLNAVYVGVGLGVLEDLLPAFAKDRLLVSERGIGLFFLVNTAVVATAQLPVARLLAGRPRARAYQVEALLWLVAWPVVLLAGLPGAPTVLLLCLAAAVIAAGECMHGSVEGPLIVDLSRRADLGRYLALNTCAIQLGWAMARGFGGWGLAHHPPMVWVAAMALAVLGMLIARLMGRQLPAHAQCSQLHEGRGTPRMYRTVHSRHGRLEPGVEPSGSGGVARIPGAAGGEQGPP